MLRALGSLFLFAGCVAALIDYFLSEADGDGFTLHPLGEMWFRLHQESWVLLQPAVERHIHPDLWFGFFEPVSQTPAAPLFAGVGLLLWIAAGALGRRRRAPY